jgi:hypothetical protein
MKAAAVTWREQIERDGFTIIPEVFSPEQADALVRGATTALLAADAQGTTVRSDEGSVYAARNVLRLWPEAATVWRRPPLTEALAAILGPQGGLVRALFFDKPPRQTWALPWHKDLTIAVCDNRLPSSRFRKPTTKAGVPHVEAPREVLDAMLTVRIHLDDVTEENGPLMVLPGSHRDGKALRFDAEPHTIFARRGDVLLIRPLVTHCSNRSFPETLRHRRILHLEFAASAQMPDGYCWHEFLPIRSVRTAGAAGPSGGAG